MIHLYLNKSIILNPCLKFFYLQNKIWGFGVLGFWGFGVLGSPMFGSRRVRPTLVPEVGGQDRDSTFGRFPKIGN